MFRSPTYCLSFIEPRLSFLSETQALVSASLVDIDALALTVTRLNERAREELQLFNDTAHAMRIDISNSQRWPYPVSSELLAALAECLLSSKRDAVVSRSGCAGSDWFLPSQMATSSARS